MPAFAPTSESVKKKEELDFPVDILDKYDDRKRRFIADYWTNHYVKFTE